MRDLQADLEICNKATPGPWEATSESDEDVRVCQIENEECVCCLALMGDYNWEKEEWKEGSKKQWNKDAEFIAASREGWPHAIERAIKAEAEVERLRLMVTSITGGLDEAIDAVHFLEAENALLRKVEEVGEILWSEAVCHRCNARECRGCSAHDFKQALSEYQSWKEGQK
jgi:hypothetical protein